MVRKEDRKKGKFSLLTEVKKLTTHTIQITSNQKVFVPQYSEVTGKIVNIAIDIYHNCSSANRIMLDEEGIKDRRALQNKALSECAMLRSLAEISHSLFHIRLKRIKYWNDLITTVENDIKKWKESDSDRVRKSK